MNGNVLPFVCFVLVLLASLEMGGAVASGMVSSPKASMAAAFALALTLPSLVVGLAIQAVMAPYSFIKNKLVAALLLGSGTISTGGQDL